MMAMRFMVMDTLVFGLWSLAFGLWSLDFGLWPLDLCPFALGPLILGFTLFVFGF
jgi:hypothetical protein